MASSCGFALRFLPVGDAKQAFLGLPAICPFSCQKRLLRSFAHFLFGLIFLLNCQHFLYILDTIQVSYWVYDVQIFPPILQIVSLISWW